MADGTVGVLQSAGADRQIDNEVVTNDVGATVYRQKVAVPGTVTVSGPLTIAEYEPTVTVTCATTTASGDNTVLAVAADKRLRLHWISCQSQPDASTTPLVKVSIGATEIYRAYGVVQHRWRILGAAGDDLVVNVSDTTAVVVTAHYELVDV